MTANKFGAAERALREFQCVQCGSPTKGYVTKGPMKVRYCYQCVITFPRPGWKFGYDGSVSSVWHKDLGVNGAR
jgi:hypothetical protein